MNRLFLLALLAFPPLLAQEDKIDQRWIYVTSPLKWEQGYRPGQPAPKLADGMILIFRPNGTLEALSCWLFKNPAGSLRIEFTEGYTFLSGTWRSEQGKIRIRYRTVYANIRPLDSSNSDKEDILDYARSKEPGRLASWLQSSALKMKFVPLQRLDDLKGLADVIAFHKSQNKR